MPRKKPKKDAAPPEDWSPTQAVTSGDGREPILNRPYEEPTRHWRYDTREGVARPVVTTPRRRASYYFKSKKVGTRQQSLIAEENQDLLDLVNRLRKDVGRWRGAGYRGATKVTKTLFADWFREDKVPRRPFWCQREAVETLVYLLEFGVPERLHSTGYRKFEVGPEDLGKLFAGLDPNWGGSEGWFPRLVDQPADDELLGLTRLGCKMATGSGKTLVMAMVITWAFCNSGATPTDTRFPRAVLCVAPNLTVRERLRVLIPGAEGNYFDDFDLIPPRYRQHLLSGRVLITNWHTFQLKGPHREGDSSYRVVDKGEETSDVFTLDRLRELADRLPILVLNDEGHHCWRPNPKGKPNLTGLSREAKKALQDDADGARVWLAGLDRINNSGLRGEGIPCILAAIDLSATPFYLSNSGFPEGSPFPWLVSDFGLVDAIECGIVKVPRLPVMDDTGKKDDAGRPDPKYFRLWEHVKKRLKPSDLHRKRPKASSVYREAEGALLTLYSQWKVQFEADKENAQGQPFTPPVLIVVCDNTDIAAHVFNVISGERLVEEMNDDGKKIKKTVYQGSPNFPLLENSRQFPKRSVRIDSKLLDKVEADIGQSRDEAAEALRRLIDTVGERGKTGWQVRCVVSVSMLTEGWDANNVTHILGLRAFGSQLLCEQVVGRGLRRRSYLVDDEGYFEPEFVDVYGIPFSLIPYRGKSKTSETPDPPTNHVYAMEERAHHRIEIPIVEGYTYDIRDSGIHCNVDELAEMVVEREPTEVYLTMPRGYEDEGAVVASDDFIKQDRTAFLEQVRMQQIRFRVAQLVMEDLIAGACGKNAEKFKDVVLARRDVFPALLQIVTEYINKKIVFKDGVDPRELALEQYVKLLCERILDGILPSAASDEAPLLPRINRFDPVTSTDAVDELTRRPIKPLTKSHLNAAPVLSQGKKGQIGEARAIEIMEDMDEVESYTPNLRHLGFQILYTYMGNEHHYEPDFVVRVSGGAFVVLEIKGLKGEIHDQDRVHAKEQAATTWCKAVSNLGRYGDWVYEIARTEAELHEMLAQHAIGVVIPFRYVKPTPATAFTECLPLVGLQAVATDFAEEQQPLEYTPQDAQTWVTWDNHLEFKQGMFIAKVRGKSMEPLVADGAFAIFRPIGSRDPRDRDVLIWHGGGHDPEHGGHFTFKTYTVKGNGTAQPSVVLKPRNRDFEPIPVEGEEVAKIRVIAEFVGVVPT